MNTWFIAYLIWAFSSILFGWLAGLAIDYITSRWAKRKAANRGNDTEDSKR